MMKIVIAGGNQSADYIVKSFKKVGNKIIIINSSKETIAYLTKSNNLPAFYGEPYSKDVLEQAHIDNADLFIALGSVDTNNLVSCLLAKRLYSVKKCICIVANPKNVEIYRRLGVDSVISSTYLLATSIVNESSLESLAKTMSFQEDKIIMSEVLIKDNNPITHQQIMDIDFPKSGTISCIYRKPHVIIPNGKTIILPGDKLFIVSSKKDQEHILSFIQGKKK